MFDVKHATVDIETLGTKPGSAVVAIGVRVFDMNGVGPGLELYIDVASAKDYGKADQDTLDWWAKQDPDVRARVMGGRTRTDTALQAFNTFIEEHRPIFVWANSPSFDVVLLTPLFAKVGLKWPFSFRNERDSRTLRAIGEQVLGLDLSGCYTEMKAHTPLDDATADAKAIIMVMNAIRNAHDKASLPEQVREVFTHPDAPKESRTLGDLGGQDL